MKLFNEFYKFLCITAWKQSPRIIKHKKSLTESQSESCVIKTGKTIWYPSYKKHYYCDKPSGEGWFFRLKPITDNGKYPVFFYLHGSGLNHAGENDFQMWEFRCLRKKLSKQLCHQVVIHCDVTYSEYACAYNTDEHSRVIEEIIRYLEDTYKNVDRKRIYIAGTSYGGYGTAYEVLRNPDKYAGAISAMGYTHNEKFPIEGEWWLKNEFRRNLTEDDFKSLAKTPFYLAWAKDDHPSISVGSAFLAEKLENYGGTVITKIYDDGAHTIASDFFRKGNWTDWLFELRR